jgi:hypothetical protein
MARTEHIADVALARPQRPPAAARLDGGAAVKSRTTPIAAASAFALLAAAAAVAVLGLSAPLDHDEHQFVASGMLLARDGLLPYRDYPYHHLPYLTFLYALVFSLTDHVLLAARITSVAFAAGAIAIVAHLVGRIFDDLRPWSRFALGAAFAVVLIVNPLFMYAAGRAWNHDASVFFALLAFYCMHRAAGDRSARTQDPGGWPHEVRWLAASGAAIGLAVGIRSSFAFLVPGYCIGVLLLPGGRDLRTVLVRAAAFSAGVAAAMLPLVPFALVSPEGFLHGNMRYNLELNPEYRRLLSHQTAMTMRAKLDYLFFEVAPLKRNLFLFLAFAATSCALVARKGRRYAFETRLIVALLPFLVFAALSATPSWYQYYYPLVPYLVLGIAFACADHKAMRWRAVALGAAAVLLAGSVVALRHYGEAFERTPRRWTAICLHELGRSMAERIGFGRMLTLGPIFPLEGGAPIYPELATGPFSYRTASLVPAGERQTLHLAGPEDLERVLTAEQPSGILTGVETNSAEKLEDALVAYATAHGYRPLRANDTLTLWARDDERGQAQLDGSECAYNIY